MTPEPAALLRAMFAAAVDAADPMKMLRDHLPARPRGRTVVIGCGKASARMAEALEAAWDGPLEGLVITRYGHECPTRRIEIASAAHPVPDAAGEAAAARMLASVQGLGAEDLVIALISGGGSALMPLPAPGITLAEKQAVNRALLASGATIGEMNTVRKHLSAIKGGRLAAAAHPARVVSLMISDVPGDDPGVIASGPTVGERTTPADARAILARHRIELPLGVAAHLAKDTPCPAPDDPRLARAEAHVIAAPMLSLRAAARVAEAAGFRPVILGDALEGEARDMGLIHAGIARAVLAHGEPAPRPAVLLSGGEATVTVRGLGRGGRNVEFLLALGLALEGAPVHALACDTDGVDGAEEVAGALIGPDFRDEARAAGIDLRAALADNDAHSVFERLGRQIVTGPTKTNVNDFRALVIP